MGLFEESEKCFKQIQDEIVARFEELGGGTFIRDDWRRPDPDPAAPPPQLGGGGSTRLMEDGALIERGKGVIHRIEDWGRRQLAFPIAKIHKAHYVLFNIEVNGETLAELESAFRFNDAVIRDMVIRRKGPMTGNSKIYEEELRDQEKEREREQRREEESAQRARQTSSDTDRDADETSARAGSEEVSE